MYACVHVYICVYLQVIESELFSVVNSVLSKEELQRELMPKMNSINSQINRQGNLLYSSLRLCLTSSLRLCLTYSLRLEHIKHTVQENINFRSLCKERDNLIAEYKQKRAAVTSLDGNTNNTTNGGSNNIEVGTKYLNDRKRDLQRSEQELSRLNEVRAQMVGRLKTLSEQTVEYKKKLDTDHFRNIEERHRRKSIECETTQMAVHDLDTYFGALGNNKNKICEHVYK